MIKLLVTYFQRNHSKEVITLGTWLSVSVCYTDCLGGEGEGALMLYLCNALWYEYRSTYKEVIPCEDYSLFSFISYY